MATSKWDIAWGIVLAVIILAIIGFLLGLIFYFLFGPTFTPVTYLQAAAPLANVAPGAALLTPGRF